MTTSVYDRSTASAPGLAYYHSSLPETSSSSSSSSSSRVASGGGSRLLGEPGPSSLSQQGGAPVSLGSWEPSIQRTPEDCSSSTLENARYSPQEDPKADHPNEDRYFALEKGQFKVFAVFDGHDGGRTAGFASSYMWELFSASSWDRAVSTGGEIVAQALEQFFKTTDREWFRSIRPYITETQSLKSVIPPVS